MATEREREEREESRERESIRKLGEFMRCFVGLVGRNIVMVQLCTMLKMLTSLLILLLVAYSPITAQARRLLRRRRW